MRILFVGDDWYGSNATSLRNALIAEGHEVLTVNTRAMTEPVSNPARRAWKKYARVSYDEHAAKLLDRQVRALTKDQDFDLLLAFKALRLSAQTLQHFDGVKIHYHPDDSSNVSHRSAIFDEAEAAYDLHVTTKSFNVAEIEARCAVPARFIWCAFDPAWHYPPAAQDALPAAPRIGFIGTRRSDRERLIQRVAEQFSGRMDVVGSGWQSLPGLAKEAAVRPGAFGAAFSKAVHRAPLQLGLLNSDNRDLHTCRSFEVPASGGLLIAERTVEHSRIFDDGVDALLFSEYEELAANLDRCLKDPGWAIRLARAGTRRMLAGGNTYVDRARQILAWAEERG